MNNILSPNPTHPPAQEELINRQRVVWASIIFTAVALISFVFSFILIARDPVWQAYVISVITTVALAVDVFALRLVWRGRLEQGLKYLFWSTLFTVPPNVLLVTNTAPILIAMVLTVGGIHLFHLQPRSWRKRYQFAPITAAVLMALVEFLQPPFRLDVGAGTGPASNLFGPFILGFLIIGLITLVFRQAWDGNIRVKVITGFVTMALVSLGILGTVTYINFRNQIRADIRQRLLNIISITALQQDGDLFASIQTADDMQGDAYQKMQAVNHAILATDRELAHIFSVRVDEQGTMVFIVDSGLEEGYLPLEVGVAYDGPGALLAENTLSLDHAIVEEDFYTDEYGTFLSAYAPIYKSDGSRAGIVGVDIFADKVLAQERSALFLVIETTLGTMSIVALLGLFLGTLFVGPVINLSAVTKKITAGDLSARAKIETQDEVGELAADFNIMTSKLQETLQGLEHRVEIRTRNLELAAEVGRAISQVRELGDMLKDACDLILKEFNLYYVQVYLTTANGSTLKLEAGTGTVGSQLLGLGHSLPLDLNSINGRAALDKHTVLITDTRKSAVFRQNSLLPETCSELAVPLIVGDSVVGVLDMQANQPGVLTREILPAFEALAGQMAVAVQNANLLAETEQARAQMQEQARRLVREGWGELLDAIHKPEQLGFVFEHNQITPLKEADRTCLPEAAESIGAPISITGEMLGSLVVEIEDETRREQTSELVYVVARQVSQQIENLRLLESAERYRYESEKAARLQTVKGWQDYMASKNTGSLGFIYDTNEVRPLGHDNVEENFKFSLPLKTREETIGKLYLDELAADDRDFANTVVERLSTHIESLRLFEETKRGQVELDKRAQQLAAVADISTASSKELDVQKMLESVVSLTQRKFGLYHAHVFLYDEGTEDLVIAACGWREGDEHEGTHGTAVIPIAQQQSLVARAARTGQPVIVNDVRNEPGWLPNPLLPDTAAELAVPLIVGDQLLGVLDIQSDRPSSFTEEDANVQTTLASQVATALQNARSYAQAQKQAEREAMLNTINQKIQSATSVESVLQIAARELGHALGAPMTIAQLSLKDSSS